ncbi:MAG: pyruvate:ferredoxin (flavodoxin) oxidoreductase [Pirellulaceae bacterium]|nr:pyruvate:ferredoxin (flavodoxin) oxidoreductase [Pirellulaceae bacterium]
MPNEIVTLDGNEAVCRIAYALSEVIAIYPITPATPMGEMADEWAEKGLPNLFGTVPEVIEMQSEAGAAGTLHGALLGGALATTFTASQGLLLMIPNMFKIAGELTPAVIHVAARTVATHALSIFCDHSDVMAARSTGFAILASGSVQEAHDMALIAHLATLRARIPFLHFFDGFRTSHEINKIQALSEQQILQSVDSAWIAAHRARSLNPNHPVLRGSAQNPDVFFQSREAVNPYYKALLAIVQDELLKLAQITGRSYRLYEYEGAADATDVIVMMGSACGAASEMVQQLTRQGRSVGLLQVRLYRPFDVAQFVNALPATTARIAVFDRTKEPGAIGEPLYLDTLAAISEAWCESKSAPQPRVIGGRYGLASKEFTPAMAKAVFDHLQSNNLKQHFTVGIYDDVSHLSLPWNEEEFVEDREVTRCVFYGLGSDGTVGANKNSVKIIGQQTPLFAQGYFVYDSKKSGSTTVSHVRVSPRPIQSTYLIRSATFVACHQFELLRRMNVLDVAEQGATFLLNSPYAADEVWKHLPADVRHQIQFKGLRFFVIDAESIARAAGLAGRINSVMQTCFFALSGILPPAQAIEQIKTAIEKSYSKKGRAIVDQNIAAIDAALAGLAQVSVPTQPEPDAQPSMPVASLAEDFVSRVTSMMIAGRGDLLPVSALPIDGTFPTGTACVEKRSIATHIPIWEPSLCIECGLCALVCPHAAIRTKRYAVTSLTVDQDALPHRNGTKADEANTRLTIQVAPEDCTGCGVCVDICPAKDKSNTNRRAILMQPKADHLQVEKRRYDVFMQLPDADRTRLHADTVKGSQLMLPLFEYSGACAGCGETPYLKLLSQLFGDRSVIANATGCSSIFGGSLPTTPWTKNADGQGPAWANSLFEDNAEFGLGIRLALDSQLQNAVRLLNSLSGQIDPALLESIVNSPQNSELEIAQQRVRLANLRASLACIASPVAQELSALADIFVRRSLWIVGGDGWAYDIGYGGLDHVLASGRNVNILVLDTGVYSNTGGQASKATPRAALAKFASKGRNVHRKDLGMMAVAYGSVYVAQIAMGANPAQAVRAFQEAESFDGPSLILAYSHCIAHGIEMSTSMSHQKDLVKSGFWPLYRYDPRHAHQGMHPFHLDSHAPTLRFKDVAMNEARFAMLSQSNPEHAAQMLELAQKDIDDSWHWYEQMAGVEREYADDTQVQQAAENASGYENPSKTSSGPLQSNLSATSKNISEEGEKP